MKMTILFLLIFSITAMAGVKRHAKSSVTFNGIGKYSSIEQVQISDNKKYTDSESEFDSDDMIKGMAAKLILSPGNTGEIIDLAKMQIITLDHEDKEYSVEAIKKLTSNAANMEDATESHEESSDAAEEENEETVRIVRNEFKVTATGEKKSINSFMCQKFTVLWLTEWENLEDGSRGTDSLFSIVWTTPMTDELNRAQEQESAFNSAYLSAIGLDMQATQNLILGSNWMSVLSSMSGGSSGQQEGPDMAGEMSKITGYPILINGKYYSIKPVSEEDAVEEEEEEESGGLFGALTKQVMKSAAPAKTKTLEPALAYYNEVISFNVTDVPGTVFEIPAGYDPE